MALSAAGVLLWVPAAHSLLSLGQVQPISPTSATDAAADISGGIAPVGGGVWIFVWPSEDSLGGTVGDDNDILFVRSTDAGRTWSTPAILDPDAATDDPVEDQERSVDVDAGLGGVVVAAWRKSGVGTGMTVSRSTDAGLTWSTPTTLAPLGTRPKVLTDGAGTWVIVWDSTDTQGGTLGDDEDLFYVRSIDNGATWSSAAVLNSDATTDTLGDTAPSLATNGAGTWVAAWNRGRMAAATSFDNGATWTPLVSVSPSDPGSGTALPIPDIATDGAGKWIVVANGIDPAGAGTGDDIDIFFYVSNDDGLSWDAPATLDPRAASDNGSDVSVRVNVGGDGTWYAAWESTDTQSGSIGSDKDLLVSRSFDNGVTWTSAGALNSSASSDRKDDDDAGLDIATDSSGTWVAAWRSALEFDGDMDQDSDILFARSDDNCPAAPAPGCKAASEARSKVQLRDRDGGSDSLTWKWKGDETLDIEYGDPTTVTEYVLCLYDAVSASPVLVVEHDVPAGVLCRNKPCWKVTNSGKLIYRDRRQEHGASRTVKLAPGADDKAKIAFKSKGPSVAPPPLPVAQDDDVTVQLHNLQGGTCWTATFSTSQTNTAERFKAKSD